MNLLASINWVLFVGCYLNSIGNKLTLIANNKVTLYCYVYRM